MLNSAQIYNEFLKFNTNSNLKCITHGARVLAVFTKIIYLNTNALAVDFKC